MVAGSGPGRTKNRSAITSVASHSTTTAAPMIENSIASNALSSLKWLRRPRAACSTMISISITEVPTTTQPASRSPRPGASSFASIQASAAAYSMNDSANFSGLNHSGAPSSVRWSSTAATMSTPASAAIVALNQNNPRCPHRASVSTSRTAIARPPRDSCSETCRRHSDKDRQNGTRFSAHCRTPVFSGSDRNSVSVKLSIRTQQNSR